MQKHTKNRPSWASQYQNEVGRTRIERGLGGPVSNLNGLGGPVLSQTRGHDSHERSTKGRWANQNLSACSAHLPTSACSAHLATSACSAHLPTSACSALCLLSTSTYQCQLGTPKCQLGTAAPQRQTLVVLRQDVPLHTHGSRQGMKKTPGFGGYMPSTIKQNHAKSSKIMSCKNHAKPCKTNGKLGETTTADGGARACTGADGAVVLNLRAAREPALLRKLTRAGQHCCSHGLRPPSKGLQPAYPQGQRLLRNGLCAPCRAPADQEQGLLPRHLVHCG